MLVSAAWTGPAILGAFDIIGRHRLYGEGPLDISQVLFTSLDWLLYAQDSPNLHGSRGYARGLIFKRDGTLVASVAQEGLVRQRRDT